jgi:hypothetical protein
VSTKRGISRILKTLHSGYDISRNDRESRGGGVLLAIKISSFKSSLSYTLLKCTWQQKFLLAILNLGMISSVSVKKFFNLVKSFHFYGGLKLAFNGPCPPWQGVWV